MVLVAEEWGWDVVPHRRCRLVAVDTTWAVEVDTAMPHLGLREAADMVEIGENVDDTTTVRGKDTDPEVAAQNGVMHHDLGIKRERAPPDLML